MAPSGTRLIAKFENEDGVLEPEYGATDTKMSPWDNFSFEITEVKEGDPEEIMKLTWDAYPYTVTDVFVKTGDGCFHVEPDTTEPGSGTVNLWEFGKKALSHIEFYAPAFFQLDAANTAAPYQIGGPTRPYEGIAGGGSYGCVGYRLNAWSRIDADFNSYSTILPNTDCSEATLTFNLKRVPPADGGSISVICAEAPAFLPSGGDQAYRQAIIAEQVIYDEDAVTYTQADVGNTFSHTVSIPQP